MEQKFKVGDLVKCIERNEKPFGKTGKIVGISDFGTNVYSVDFGEGFDGHNDGGNFQTYTHWNLYQPNLELAYPSDHDLLDFAARDSKIAELTAENEALKAELEKYKPKPESFTKDIVLIEQSGGRTTMHIVDCGKIYGGKEIARKTITITEGEGM